jgi:hypothetical protein
LKGNYFAIRGLNPLLFVGIVLFIFFEAQSPESTGPAKLGTQSSKGMPAAKCPFSKVFFEGFEENLQKPP